MSKTQTATEQTETTGKIHGVRYIILNNHKENEEKIEHYIDRLFNNVNKIEDFLKQDKKIINDYNNNDYKTSKKIRIVEKLILIHEKIIKCNEIIKRNAIRIYKLEEAGEIWTAIENNIVKMSHSNIGTAQKGIKQYEEQLKSLKAMKKYENTFIKCS